MGLGLEYISGGVIEAGEEIIGGGPVAIAIGLTFADGVAIAGVFGEGYARGHNCFVGTGFAITARDNAIVFGALVGLRSGGGDRGGSEV